jgi:two-component system alkaline phosphatase synthesis response regulator PhoP
VILKQTSLQQTIFAVEDESAIQDLYTYSLESEFNCRCFDNGGLFFDALAKIIPDLVLLDVMLPGDDGFAILSRLKSEKTTAHITVIMVSAKGDEISKVKGLNMGADDYIAKPFGVLELIARIKANLRKNDKTIVDGITYKDIVIDFNKHQVNVNGIQIKTTLKEYDLLCLLCANAEKVQEREIIFDKVWGENYVAETRTLDIHINEIRKKIAAGKSEVSIQTIRGVGYILS